MLYNKILVSFSSSPFFFFLNGLSPESGELSDFTGDLATAGMGMSAFLRASSRAQTLSEVLPLLLRRGDEQ